MDAALGRLVLRKKSFLTKYLIGYDIFLFSKLAK